MSATLIKNATIINEGRSFKGSVLIKDQYIDGIYETDTVLPTADTIIDAEGLLLLPGVIDDQVHFREPGLTHKADIASESAAAVAGGVTSYMEMPNTNPQTTTITELENKFAIASQKSLANYSFFLGATNDNLDELLKADPATVCGVKVFMGSSTGNMLVDDKKALERIFSEVRTLIATHCEDEATIRANMELYRSRYGEEVPFSLHHEIRNAEACYKSSSMAVELAAKHNTRLHILHISTQKELSLFDNSKPIEEKNITSEVCVHHLWFTSDDYASKGAHIKWNPAVKTPADREALREALKNNRLDVVATDHAPHTLEEKSKTYFNAPSGGPLVQHSLPAMLQMSDQGIFSRELVVEKMCHAPAKLFRIDKRGFIRKGYYADLVLVQPGIEDIVSDSTVLYKCKWTPFDGQMFNNKVLTTWVNGHAVYNKGVINTAIKGKRLAFNPVN
ncbi:MAG: dihydroorotase [Bacteroidota bacterium]|nr:dihydroorotase [Bacteroidota bacterium]